MGIRNSSVKRKAQTCFYCGEHTYKKDRWCLKCELIRNCIFVCRDAYIKNWSVFDEGYDEMIHVINAFMWSWYGGKNANVHPRCLSW